MEGASRGSTRGRILSTPTERPASPPTRGQHGSGRRPIQAYLPVTRHDDRAPSLVGPPRHQRHPHPPALHSVGRKRVGGHTQPRTRHRGMAAQFPPIRTPLRAVGPPYYRPVRVHAKHPAPAVQRPMEGPSVRGRRLFTPSRRNLATRKQLVQPSLDRPTGTRRQTGPIASPNDRHRPLLAKQDVVPRLTSPRHRDLALPSVPRPFLSRQARQVRGGWTTRVEHRGFSANTPSWLYTRRGAIGRALRPAMVWFTVPPIRPSRAGPPRYRLQTDSTQAPWSSDIA
jgi:hypothetical protein